MSGASGAATRHGGFECWATTAPWHADRAARRPKPAKLATDEALRRCVEDRLAGMIAAPEITAPEGATAPGLTVPWAGRRSVRRQHRR